jgi:hypothetical protein
MSYAVNDTKKDPETGIVAVKTGMTDTAQSWLIVMTSDGSCHYAADADVADWTDLDVIGAGS